MSDVWTVDRGRPAHPRFGHTCVGLTFLLPGLPQWLWQQRERGMLLFGSFAAALAAGLFAWGTRTSLALLAFAYLAHVVSALDAIRQWSFPGFGRWSPAVSVSAGLAVGCYGPMILVASLVAWPGMDHEANREGYLVNRLTYESRPPEAGERIWLGAGPGERSGRFAEVLAVPGQEVAWSDGTLHINGRRRDSSPFGLSRSPRMLAFKVPEDRLLVSFQTADPFLLRAWELVPKSRVEGRVWAKFYPVWERKLLP